MFGFSIKILALYGPPFVSLIWGITLLFKNYKTKNPGYYMSYVLFSAFCIFLGIIPFYHDNIVLSVKLEPIYFIGLLSIFPFVYFYVRFITTKQRIKPTAIYRHLIPAALISCNSLLMQIVLTSEEKASYALREAFTFHENPLLFYFTNAAWIIRIVLIVQSLFYLYKSSELIGSYKNNVRAYFSNIKGKYFNWIHIFYFIFAISILAAIPPLIVGNAYLINGGGHLLTASFFTLSFVFYAIGYMADNHGYIEEEDFYIQTKTALPANSVKVYRNLGKRIEDYFVDSKPYLNKELKITDVANVLGSNRTYISDTMKIVFNSNFNKYVNVYRIEEAVAIFKDTSNDHRSTVEISEQVGFHTYSSFVKSFREQYKTTPAVYRRNISSVSV